jgi:phosphohistidine phosphatase
LGGADLIYDAGLYQADAADLLRRIQRLPADASAVMVVGHNPALHVIALELTESGGGDDSRLGAFPPGALACIAAPSDWSQIRPGAASLEWLVVPTEVGDE